MNNDLRALREKVFSFFDTTTKNEIGVKISENYLTIRLNEKIYYFSVEDGKYDGYSIDLTYIPNQNLPSQTDAIFS